MAIEGTFNLSQATTSQAYAYKCWYNYNYGGNTLNISASDMNEITKSWHSELSNWRATATNDENRYEIDDDDFSSAKLDGRKQAEEQTGFDGEADKNTLNNAASWTGGIAGGIMGVVTTITSLSKNKGMISNPYTSAVVGGILLANAIYLKSAKPNEEAADACDEMQNVLTDSQGALTCAQEDMAIAQDEIVELSDEAAMYNDEANEQIEENKAEFDIYQETYQALIAKMESGEPLEKNEKDLLKSLVPIMLQLNLDTTELQESTSEDVNDIYDETASYQEIYDNAAETVAEVQGATDFAASFDEATEKNAGRIKTGAIIATVGSAGVLASGGQAVASAGLNIGQYIAGGIAIATGASAGVLYGCISAEQGKYQGKAEAEIAMRETTQDLNTTTDDVYTESIADFDGYMSTIEDLELEIPDDMEAPEETPAMPAGENGNAAAGGGLGVSPKPEEEDKEKPKA